MFVRNIMANVRIVGLKFGLEVGGWWWSYRGDRTYVQGMENPVELQTPGGDRFIVVLLAKTPRDRISSTLFNDVLLDFGHDTGIKNFISQSSDTMYRWFNSHRQLLNCPENGLTGLICSPSIYPPVKGFTDVSAA